jgi:hypothetical protein
MLYAAFYCDTDNCTYWCDQFLGVFDSKDKADEFILKQVESGQFNWRKLEDYEVREVQVNVPLD